MFTNKTGREMRLVVFGETSSKIKLTVSSLQILPGVEWVENRSSCSLPFSTGNKAILIQFDESPSRGVNVQMAYPCKSMDYELQSGKIVLAICMRQIAEVMKKAPVGIELHLNENSGIRDESFKVPNERLYHDIRRLISEMANAPVSIRKDYLKVKVMELILLLNAREYVESDIASVICGTSHQERLQLLGHFLRQNIDRHYTLEELSRKFGLSQTVLKSGFKEVYGETVYAYFKRYRMEFAARLLIETDDTVGQIALRVGYNNPSKFAEAFKKTKGMTPTEFKLDKIIHIPHKINDRTDSPSA